MEEEQSKRDLKRIGALLAIFLSIVIMGIVVFSQKFTDAITGAVVITELQPLTANTWVVAAVAALILIIAAIILSRLNSHRGYY
ncbi:MAG: hypothetical protein KKD75_04350 [Nanoarchaeota archaeon]|nr:hypothetical protein [Nanoarchaeota archaeon]MBU1875984.1 hypothetical protein [Nanoarchaeota archaeon]